MSAPISRAKNPGPSTKSSPGLRIRHACPDDATVIAQFNAAIAWETENQRLDPERVRHGVAALLSDRAKGIYFLAELGPSDKPEVVGQVLVTYEWSDWRNGNFWWIQSVYVMQACRGQGVFRALFDHVQNLAKSYSDVCGLRLYMDAHNAAARSAYERLGMKRTNYEIFEMDFVLKRKP